MEKPKVFSIVDLIGSKSPVFFSFLGRLRYGSKAGRSRKKRPSDMTDPFPKQPLIKRCHCSHRHSNAKRWSKSSSHRSLSTCLKAFAGAGKLVPSPEQGELWAAAAVAAACPPMKHSRLRQSEVASSSSLLNLFRVPHQSARRHAPSAKWHGWFSCLHRVC